MSDRAVRYSELYKDPRWQRRRLKVMEQANFKCEKCGKKNRTLHVHHRIYRRGSKPWEYDDHELRCLCEDCHEAATELQDLINERVNELGAIWGDEVLFALLDVLATECGPPGWEIEIPNYEVAVGVAQAWRIDPGDVIAEAAYNNKRVSESTLRRMVMHHWTGVFRRMWAGVNIHGVRPQAPAPDTAES